MYFFYDLETSGLNRFYDQPFQAGIVITDDDFNIIKTFDLNCRRLPWVVPMPMALLTTGKQPEDLDSEDLPDFYTVMRQVFDLINELEWPVNFSGYNIIGYDNPLFSSAMHQAHLDAFVMTGRQKWTDLPAKPWNDSPNKSIDILNIVRAVQVYMPDALTLKKTTTRKNPDGTEKTAVTLKLGEVCRQNGIDLNEDSAHDAVADIKATIALARLVKKVAPDIWNQMTSLATKASVEKFVLSNPVFAYTPGYEDACYLMTTVTAYQSKLAGFDLSFDPAEFVDKTPEELARYLRYKNEDDEQPVEKDKNPFHAVRANAQPVLMPLDRAPDSAWPKGVDQAILEARAAQIKGAKQFQENLAAAFKIAYPEIISKEPEEQIYQFPSKGMRAKVDAWLREFFNAPDTPARRRLMDCYYKRFGVEIEKEKAENKQKHGQAFSALERHLLFALRRMYVEAPELLGPGKKESYLQGVHRRINGKDEAPYPRIKEALAEVAELRIKIAAGEQPVPGKDLQMTAKMLDKLEAWYHWMEVPPGQRQAFSYAPSPQTAKKKLAGPDSGPG